MLFMTWEPSDACIFVWEMSAPLRRHTGPEADYTLIRPNFSLIHIPDLRESAET